MSILRAFGAGFGPGLQGRRGSSSAPSILRLSFTVAALVQMLVYCFVVLYSVTLGGIDLVLPAKTAFLTIVFVLLLKPLDDLSVAWRIREFDRAGAEDALVYFSLAFVAGLVSITVDIFFLTNPLSNIDLRGEGLEVKVFIAEGVVILLLYVLGQFRPLLGLGVRKLRSWSERRK
jgi:hypothetical protein